MRPTSSQPAFPANTKRITDDTVLEHSGKAVMVPASEKTTVYKLARTLEVPMARIIQAIKQLLPKHPRLAEVGPNTVIRQDLSEAIRRCVSGPTFFPRDPQVWVG